MYSAEVYSPHICLPISHRSWISRTSGSKAALEVISPPPNVTGELHLGHVLNLCLQRAYSVGSIRWGRMPEWIFGLDHAGIAAKHVLLRWYGLASVRRFWAWKKRIARIWLIQLERLLSFKLSKRTRFTLDEAFKAAVAYAFVKLWKHKLVTQQRRLVAWDESVKCLVSNLETFRKIEYVKQMSWKFVLTHSISLTWHNSWVSANYVAVNRPFAETPVFAVVLGLNRLCSCKLGFAKLRDAANIDSVSVLVSTKDDAEGFCVLKSTRIQRYSSLLLCVICAAETQITGLLKARICRQEIKLCCVMYSQKTKYPLTPKVSLQWFVKLVELAAARNRLTDLCIWPSKWRNKAESWVDDLGLWCVSRSMAWGHKLPVWRIDERFVVRDTYSKALYYWLLRDGVFEHTADSMMCGLKQDPLVLDTWFSSALWRLSCLGWPHKTSQLRLQYGSGVVFTGFDILFFWIIKMVLVSSWLMKSKCPFKSVVIHPIICDSAGAKMSKTKANAIHPRVITNAYGPNTTCIFMASARLWSQQFKMSTNSLISSRNAITKLWNLGFAAAKNKTEDLICRRAVCKLALFDIYNKLMRVELRLRNFNFDNYDLELIGIARGGDLKRLSEMRNASCRCIRRLARYVWNFYFPITPCCFRKLKIHTRFSKTTKLYSLLAKLFTPKVSTVTNCIRLFCQSSEIITDFATANVCHISSLRISNRFEIYLWNNSLIMYPTTSR
ncbi:MAG: class I tRNA ligase family protein [Candidatus Hodgkinia cicadicola]